MNLGQSRLTIIDWLTTLFSKEHVHKLERVEWLPELGDSLIYVSEYTFVAKHLYRCKCGHEEIHRYGGSI